MTFFQTSREWINGEGIWSADSRILILAFLHATMATDHSDGIHPPTFVSLNGG
jgi:hypothetical protein